MIPQRGCVQGDKPIVSPSLLPAAQGQVPAYELKFLLSEAQARAMEAWAQSHLALDPHIDPAMGNAYRTTTLYCDTAQFDVFYRTASKRRRKFRLRRYGRVPWVFLERKTKTGDRVRKRRAQIPEDELLLLAHPFSVLSWPGHWFHRRLLARQLQPACQIIYERSAYVGLNADGAVRLTLDRNIRGELASAWSLPGFEGGSPLLKAGVIGELKYRAALPALFKELIGDLSLCPCTVSKYRLCIQACGGLPARRCMGA